MKISLLVLFFMSVVGPSLFADEGKKICSTIDYCRVEKKIWTRKGWKSEYVKETNFNSFCEFDRPALQLEPELGIELWLFQGDKTSVNWLESQPHVTVDLYTYKLTNVVASGSAPLNEPAIAFTDRLTSKGKTFIQVTCYKK